MSDEKYMENHVKRLDYEKLVHDFVESTGIENVFITRKAALTLYSCGKTSGVVLKSGGFETQVSSVEEGFVRQEGCLDGAIAGNALTKAIAKQMNELDVYSSESQSWNTWMTYQLAEQCKKKLLRLQAEDGEMEEEFKLPDGSLFSLDQEIDSLNKYPFGDTRKGVIILKHFWSFLTVFRSI